MMQATVNSALLEPVVDVGNWRVTLLDSAVPGSVPGYLQDQQLQLLAQSWSEAPTRHHLVCFHHHPVSIGCAWMEPIGLRNPDPQITGLALDLDVKETAQRGRAGGGRALRGAGTAVLNNKNTGVCFPFCRHTHT